jgi:hypothetical protein
MMKRADARLFLLALLLPQPAFAATPALVFSAHPELRRVTTEVSVTIVPNGKRPEYLFRKTIRPDGGAIAETQWADSRTCEGARAMLAEVHSLPAARPHLFGIEPTEDLILVADGTTYRLESEASPPYGTGRISLSSNRGTPLAKWVEGAFSVLTSCWKASRS